MKRLGTALGLGIVATVLVAGFADYLPQPLQTALMVLSIYGATITGANVHVGDPILPTIAAFFVAGAIFYVSLPFVARIATTAPLAARWGAVGIAFTINFLLYLLAFRTGSDAAFSAPWTSPTIAFAWRYAVVGVASAVWSHKPLSAALPCVASLPAGILFLRASRLREAAAAFGNAQGSLWHYGVSLAQQEAVSYGLAFVAGLVGWGLARGLALTRKKRPPHSA